MIYEFKIVRHVLREDVPDCKVIGPADVVRYVENYCQPKDEQWREMAWVLTVNRSGVIQGHFLLSVGGTHATVIDKKAVAKVAIERMADAVILVHNHPSGDCLPSESDIRETSETKRALSCLDVKLLDHVILGDGEYFSFAEEKKYE